MSLCGGLSAVCSSDPAVTKQLDELAARLRSERDERLNALVAELPARLAEGDLAERPGPAVREAAAAAVAQASPQLASGDPGFVGQGAGPKGHADLEEEQENRSI